MASNTPNASNTEVMEKLQQIEERLSQLEREQRPRFLRGLLARLVPREVRRHLLAARREQLLAVEAYLDHLINRLEQAEKQGEGHPRRRIAVE